ncbi:helix-turn-helix transcriptional regulator [Enterococcus pseudoavium]|uniref:Helix-turn-helix transcriptional regulator n=1 Tax=Enterococcus pseudoavium TaxID=44007 RepID=A0AAE4KVU2_9ENTE|nr:helix-turn-helix transcriptional regulator [Enterococcus pseudoavium]MDT2735905.1 helix-turn-helix transcriptional regulator [Enterococcus pseudoavium]REC31023.1 transcriptional regulator [Enterococcus pseudoavium]
MELGKIIKESRKNYNMTQQEVAEILNISRQTLSNWETGKNYPDVFMLLKLADFYSLSLDTMLRGDGILMKKIENDAKQLSFFKEFPFYLIIDMLLVAFSFVLFFSIRVRPEFLTQVLPWQILVCMSSFSMLVIFFNRNNQLFKQKPVMISFSILLLATIVCLIFLALFILTASNTIIIN